MEIWEEEGFFFLRIMTIYDGFGANGSCLFSIILVGFLEGFGVCE